MADIVARPFIDAHDEVTLRDGQDFKYPKGLGVVSYAMLRFGDYEKSELEILENFEPDSTVIEIGSNIGVVARHVLCKKVESGGTLICVEANRAFIPALTANLEDYKGDKTVKILPVAIGAPEKDGECQTFQNKMDLGSSLSSTIIVPKGHAEQVPVRSLSSIVNEHTNGKGYSLVADVEGAEILIIEKDAGAFASCRQIAIELHHPRLTGLSTTPDQMIDKLEDMGFHHRYAIGDVHYLRRKSGQALAL